MRIYLDTCCYNRPFDRQKQLLVQMETLCKIHIQDFIEAGKHTLASSFTLDFECSRIPVKSWREMVMQFIRNNTELYVDTSCQEEIETKAAEIMQTGIKFRDACHVASAIYAGCDYFITVEKRLLKYRTEEIRMVSPIQFIMETEGTEDGQTGQ